MKVLALDISTKTGWAVFEESKPVSWGTLLPDKGIKDFGKYPFNYVYFAHYLADRIEEFLVRANGYPNLEIVIEETNTSRQNYSQKILEYIHFSLINRLGKMGAVHVYYIRTGEWRKATETRLSKEEKSLNAKIARIKKKTGKKLAKIDGKVVGRKGRKHVALRVVRETFGIELKRKDEDAADALLLGQAYLKGSPVCDGSTHGGKSNKA